MIGRVLHIARREWLEQRRQPAMLGVVAALFAVLTAVVLVAVGVLDRAWSDPATARTLGDLWGIADPSGTARDLAGSALGLYAFLLFTQLLGFASVLAGHAVLHDRQCGTLAFLLLAPVRRHELLVGKLLGAVGPTVLIYALVGGAGSLAAAAFPVAREHPDWLPLSAAWWLAFLGAGPLWALCVGALCTVISSLARDVRTAQQSVWFLVFFATLGCGTLLTWTLPAGVAAVLASAALAACGAAATLFAGSQVISRDLGR